MQSRDKLILAFAIGSLAGVLIHRGYQMLRVRHEVALIAPSGGYLSRRCAMAGDAKVVFIGDSITDYWRDYPDLWKRYFDDALNAGVAGERTVNVLWRIRNGELRHPRVVVVMLGTNDLAHLTPAQAAENMRELVRELRAATGARVLLLGVPPINDKAKEFNRLLARTENDVRFIDIGERIFGDDNGRSSTCDGLHPNAEGYRRWGEALTPILEPMLRD